jgi:hypothetical protein
LISLQTVEIKGTVERLWSGKPALTEGISELNTQAPQSIGPWDNFDFDSFGTQKSNYQEVDIAFSEFDE